MNSFFLGGIFLNLGQLQNDVFGNTGQLPFVWVRSRPVGHISALSYNWDISVNI